MAVPSRPAAVLSVVALLAVVALACGSDGDDGSADRGSADEPAILVADLQRSTLFDTRREFGLSLATEGDADLRLETIQLVTPLFETEAPTPRDTTIRVGDRPLVMPLPYGTAVCDDASAEAGPAEVVAVVDGEEMRVPVTLHPDDMLSGLHERECATAAVLEDVGLALDGEWTVVDPTTATGQLTATQRNAGVTARVDELLGNVILDMTTPGASPPILQVDDAQPSASVDVSVSAARCDPHALTEYKRTFVFVALVHVTGGNTGDEDDGGDDDEDDGDDEPVRIDVRAEGPAHAAISQILTSCVA